MFDDLDFGLEERAPRFLVATLKIALAVFLIALAFGIVSAKFTGPPALSWLLRGFIVLMFGGIAAGSLWSAQRTIRGDAQKASRVPEEALARCLVCGERSPAELGCPICGEAPADRRNMITVARKTWIGMAIGVAISAALLCLGLFITIGPFFDGERRIWALIAFAALGLLMTAIGVAGLFGSVVSLISAIDGGSTLSFRMGGTERRAWGAGGSRWGKLQWLEGHARIVEPPLPRPKSEGGYRVSPGDIEFAEMIATLDASGILRVEDVTTHEWCVGEKPKDPDKPALRTQGELAFNRKTSRSTWVTTAPGAIDFVANDGDDDGLENVISVTPSPAEAPLHAVVRQFFHPWFVRAPKLVDAQRLIDADPARRAQALAHTRSLVDAGVRVSPEMVDAVLCRLEKA